MSDHDDTRAHKLREDYHAVFGGDELPVPVESIAEDLLGLAVEARDELAVSGMLLPPERRILVNAAEPEPRRRFAIATNWAIGSASALRACPRRRFEKRGGAQLSEMVWSQVRGEAVRSA
ncbi:MAG: hypothetical protein H0V45_07080, partial [Actinobacteria bacterium]|nr:hypothetical protein [Actinomycetota bacterium]